MTTIVTLDMETFYDREYSLSKLTTEEYVRSPLFETIGIGAKFDNYPTDWIAGPEVGKALSKINWSDKIIVCQNTAFDGSILKWHYGVEPLAWFDIMGMSRALYPHEKSHSLKAQAERMGVGVKGDEVLNALGKRYADFSPEELARYGEYCINDVELTHKLFTLYMQAGFPKQELKLIDLTLRMFIDPVLQLDAPLLTAHLTDVRERKAALLDKVRDMLLDGADPEHVNTIFSEGAAGIKTLMMSNEKFATLLRTFGAEPPMKISPATGKPAYAFAKTDEEFKALEEHPSEDVQALVACRLGNKTTIEETRTERFIGMAHRGSFPVPLRYYGAHSGRWSGQDKVNLQNLPSRGANAGRIKKAIMAPPGHVVIDCDSSQIEARTLAWLAGQADLVEAFEKNNAEKLAGVPSEDHQYDVYKIMAQKIYNVPMNQITKQQRQVGKTVILGAGYGVGSAKLQLFLKTQAGVIVDAAEAKRIIDTYRQTYSRIQALWRTAEAGLGAMALEQSMQIDVPGIITAIPGKGLTLPSGLFIQYPNLRRVQDDGGQSWVYDSKGVMTKVYGGKCVENFSQAVARCVVAEQMLRIAKRYKVVLTVHDSVAVVAPEADVEDAMAFVEGCMRWAPKWAVGLPLACEAGYGASYGDC